MRPCVRSIPNPTRRATSPAPSRDPTRPRRSGRMGRGAGTLAPARPRRSRPVPCGRRSRAGLDAAVEAAPEDPRVHAPDRGQPPCLPAKRPAEFSSSSGRRTNCPSRTGAAARASASTASTEAACGAPPATTPVPRRPGSPTAGWWPSSPGRREPCPARPTRADPVPPRTDRQHQPTPTGARAPKPTQGDRTCRTPPIRNTASRKAEGDAPPCGLKSSVRCPHATSPSEPLLLGRPPIRLARTSPSVPD